MNHLSIRSVLCLAVPLVAVGLGGAVAACSGNTSSGNPGNDNDASAGTDTGTHAGSCANSTLAISFSPMYSAFIPGSTQHSFQIPAVVDGATGVTWSATDPSLVSLSPDPTTGGTMITVLGTGPVSIIATAADGTCGASVLNITSATDSDWQVGNARYNDGNSLRFPGRRDGGGGGGQDASMLTPDAGPACTNCHGPTAMNGLFNDVSHTPEQTGGFSDQQLIDIIVNGNVPDGGYFDPNVILSDAAADPARSARAYNIWHSFHQWSDIGPDQQQGIVVYLRSLTPAPQDGTSNFGGGRDGGRRDGGRRDGGGGMMDAGAPADAAGE